MKKKENQKKTIKSNQKKDKDDECTKKREGEEK